MNIANMDANTTSHYLAIIKEQRGTLAKITGDCQKQLRTGEHEANTIGAGKEEGDCSSLNHAAYMHMKRLETSAAKIKMLDRAIQRLEKGTFGFCAACSEKIDERRLQLIPYAVYCRDCQEQSEKHERKHYK